MVTLERIRYFIEAATLEHVGNAARKLHVSPSVISSAIQELEEEFHCQFFEREKNRLRLNEKGHLFLMKAKGLMESVNNLSSEISSETMPIKGHYRLGGSHYLLNHQLVPAFLKVKKVHPSITAEFITMDTGLAIANVLSGSLDAALVFRSALQHDVDEHQIRTSHFQIAVRKNHPIQKLTKAKKVQVLNGLPAITFKPTIGANYVQGHPIFKEFGIMPHHTYFYSDDQTVLQLLMKTDGWAFLPEEIIEENKKHIEKIDLGSHWKAPVTISLIQNKSKLSSRLVLELKAALVN